jgi:hypothetical protein
VYAEGFSAGPPPDLDTLKTRYHEGLRAFVASVRDAGIPLLVTAYPSHLAFTDSEATPFAWFERLARAESLRFVSARDALLASGIPKSALYLLPLDGHANATGYSVVAKAIATDILNAPLGAINCSSRTSK